MANNRILAGRVLFWHSVRMDQRPLIWIVLRHLGRQSDSSTINNICTFSLIQTVRVIEIWIAGYCVAHLTNITLLSRMLYHRALKLVSASVCETVYLSLIVLWIILSFYSIHCRVQFSLRMFREYHRSSDISLFRFCVCYSFCRWIWVIDRAREKL